MKLLRVYLLLSLSLASCQNKDLFYIQHTVLRPDDLPKDCNKELVQKINTQWLKHGKSNCHYYNILSQSFAMENMECAIGMNKKMLVQLLGKPDIINDWKMIYRLDKECGDEKMEQRNRAFRADIVFVLSSELEVTDVIFRSKKGR